MKNIFNLALLILVILQPSEINSQGIIAHSSHSENHNHEHHIACGSFDLMEEINSEENDYLNLSDQFMRNLSRTIKHQQNNRTFDELLIIPVVFHVVYNSDEENLPDSVLYNQLDILNECFRRQNSDTTETRPEFLEHVGDTKIEFRFADFDPSGGATNGINRVYTETEYFGGILPYSAGENEEIIQWVSDSLLVNLYEITESNAGGSNPWDTEEYLNIWIGDLRIFEPEFNDFEELVYFGLATPPIDHENWPDELISDFIGFNQGVLIHYVNVGNNNPNNFPAAYSFYNGPVTTGEIMVHEVGHYLGLRHIWGDGNCSFDDYIQDTPLCNASSSWDCNQLANTCTDDIGGIDLPNMVENYMDYSSGDCQNSFTINQAELMRSVLEEYRPLLADVVTTVEQPIESLFENVTIYPNPAKNKLNLEFESFQSNSHVEIRNNLGQIVFEKKLTKSKLIELELNLVSGVYFVQFRSNSHPSSTHKLIIE